MGSRLDPGPPLTPGEEYCPSDPPTGAEYARAVGVSLLVILGGGAGWFAVVMATQRLWGVAMVAIGILTGMAIHRAAGRHKSMALGIMAVVAAVLASALGYGLLYIPFVDSTSIDRELSWIHLAMLGIGGFIAYRLAGAKVNPDKPL